MKTIAQAIIEGRKAAGMTQSQLARRLKITPQSVQAWESGRSTPRPLMLADIGDALNLPVEGLMSLMLARMNGDGVSRGKLLRSLHEPKAPAIEANAEIIGRMDIWDDETPLDDDEIDVPFLKEVELAAGSGRTAVEVSSKRKLRFGKRTLRSQGVQFDNAVCLTVHGDSMSPVLPDGSTVGVDTGSSMVRDGRTYAINQGGQLRVKTLHRLPNGGVRMRSFNREEYPDEEYSLEDMAERDIKVIGRVFWSSVLW